MPIPFVPVLRSFPSSPLEAARLGRGETVVEFANQLLVTRDYYYKLCRYERRPGSSTAEAIRAILGWDSIEQVHAHWWTQYMRRKGMPAGEFAPEMKRPSPCVMHEVQQ